MGAHSRTRLESLIAEGRDVVSVIEAAQILGLSRSFAYERARDGSIPTVRLGRKIVVPVAQLRRLLDGGDAS